MKTIFWIITIGFLLKDLITLLNLSIRQSLTKGTSRVRHRNKPFKNWRLASLQFSFYDDPFDDGPSSYTLNGVY
jgi:hypothetical protein